MFKRKMAVVEKELEELQNQPRQPDEELMEDMLHRKAVLLKELQSKINQTIKNRNRNKKRIEANARNIRTHKRYSKYINMNRKLLSIILDDNMKGAHEEYERHKANLERTFQSDLDQLLQHRDASIREYKEMYANDDYKLYEMSKNKISEHK